jgi:hypothetical protein
VEVGSGAAVDFVAREQVNGVLSGGIGGEFGSEVGDDGDGAGGEFAFGVALTNDDFGADVPFSVDDIATLPSSRANRLSSFTSIFSSINSSLSISIIIIFYVVQ